jgi:hypothetical protein
VAYTINYKISGNFLKVELSGSYPLEKFKEISSDIDSVIDSNGIRKIMVDLRDFKGRFGVFDGLNHIEKFRDESRFLKFAILDNDENKEKNDFFENASHNRGYNLLFFYDEAEAKKWLQVERYPEPEKLLFTRN